MKNANDFFMAVAYTGVNDNGLPQAVRSGKCTREQTWDFVQLSKQTSIEIQVFKNGSDEPVWGWFDPNS